MLAGARLAIPDLANTKTRQVSPRRGGDDFVMADHKLTEDEKVLHNMGYAQELSRRMANVLELRDFLFDHLHLSGGITSFPVAFSAGGGFSAATSAGLVGGFFALVVAASLGQIASAYPTAGGALSLVLDPRRASLGLAVRLDQPRSACIFVVASVNFGRLHLHPKDLVLHRHASAATPRPGVTLQASASSPSSPSPRRCSTTSASGHHDADGLLGLPDLRRRARSW